MSVGTLILGGGALVVAAEIATWCFKSAATGERQFRRDFVRGERAHRRVLTQREREHRREVSQRERAERRAAVQRERAERREIEREARRQLAQQAYEQRGAWLDMLSESMRTVWDMRNRTRELRGQFQEIVRANELLIRTSPLTFQQQEAIRDCVFHLERGIARLQAYSGPYLQAFISDIAAAKRAALQNSFVEPEMPDSVLPDDFPVVGDNLRLSPSETETLRKLDPVALGDLMFAG